MILPRATHLVLLLGGSFAVPALPAAPAAGTTEQRVARLEQRVRRLHTIVSLGLVSGAVCALRAQNSGRNAWLWLLAGLIFSALALVLMLYRNAADLRLRRGHSGGPQPPRRT